MNKYAKNHKSKGISVDGFWSRLKDKTEKKPSGTESRDSRDLSKLHLPELNSQLHKNSRDMSKSHDDWVARFDEWLDGL